MNPYEILQISPGTTPDKVREAYHELAKKWHPDRFNGQEKLDAEVRFREIAEAYAAIKKGVAQDQVARPSSPAATPQKEKKPEDWLAEAKMALANKQYDVATSLSKYCFNNPSVAEGSRVVYAAVIDATNKDLRVRARAYEDVLRINPNNKDAIIKLSELYDDLQMPLRAEGMREKAKSLGINIKQARNVSEVKPPVQESAGIVDKIADFFKVGKNRGCR